jgi:hypothetical protein
MPFSAKRAVETAANCQSDIPSSLAIFTQKPLYFRRMQHIRNAGTLFVKVTGVATM